MKRLLIIFSVIVLSAGCSSKKSTVQEKERVNVSMFMTVEHLEPWWIVADRKTGVMYAVSIGSYNRGTFTLLVDADGKPLIYEGEDNLK